MKLAARFFGLSPDMLCLLTPDGALERVNPAFERVTGYSVDDLKRSSWFDLVHPDERPAARAVLTQSEQSAATTSLEHRYRRKSGDYRWVQWTFHWDSEEGLWFLIGRDATSRKEHIDRLEQHEVDLRKSKDELENLVQAFLRASGQILYTWDPATNAVSYDNVERALGYTPEELAGGFDRWMELVHPDDRATVIEEVDRVVEAKLPFSMEYRVRRKDEVFIHVEDNGYFVLDADGDITYMVGFVADASARKELEDKLRQSQKMEAVGRLAGGIAHDFNNLLTAILSYSDMALTRLSHLDPIRDDIAEIREAGLRARSLTSQLLAFSRKQILKPRMLDLNRVVRNMEHLLRRVIGEDIDLRIHLEPNLDPIEFDPGQLEQIVMNLAVNARDAMPGGGKLTIQTGNIVLDEEYVRSHVDTQEGPHVMLAVTDTGSGMDAKTQARIFEPFFTTKGPHKGTGLGLSTVYGIVKQSGGNLWVYSELGRGTTFKVYLPRTETDRARQPTNDSIPALIKSTETILVVEDDQSVRRVIERVLGSGGYTVLCASDADEAEQLSRRHEGTIHLLLTDVVLPNKSGHELAKSLVSQRPGLRVLYMSGYTDDAIVHHGVLDPEVAFLEKPLMPTTLLTRVREILRQP
ncbi:MAG: PAS domain-containing protein [Myxococcota bacterium]